jgi:CMP-N-acetylneuraminic acid synthetase
MANYAIIPIRSGSKRFPNKNIFSIEGLPLFHFAAHVARLSGVFDKVIITSDSEEYLKIAQDYGYDLHKRSEAASSDHASSEDIIDEVLRDFDMKEGDWAFLIQATSPFQQEHYFQAAAAQINSGIASIVTYRSFKRFFLEDVIGKERKRTQDFASRKLETGMFWGFNVGAFLEKKNRIIEPYGLVEIKEFDDVDIDYFEDIENHIPRLKALAQQYKAEKP